MAQSNDRRPPRRTVNRTFSLNDGDLLLLDWAASYLNTSQSEVARAAIRAYVFHLQQIGSRTPA